MSEEMTEFKKLAMAYALNSFEEAIIKYERATGYPETDLDRICLSEAKALIEFHRERCIKLAMDVRD